MHMLKFYLKTTCQSSQSIKYEPISSENKISTVWHLAEVANENINNSCTTSVVLVSSSDNETG